MSLKNFRTFGLSVQFHRSCVQRKLPGYLKNQLLRASSSISLNVAEGSSKPTIKDRVKFYHIALGSLRECQAALELCAKPDAELIQMADELGGCLFRLCYPKS